jgi:hypothetical protein
MRREEPHTDVTELGSGLVRPFGVWIGVRGDIEDPLEWVIADNVGENVDIGATSPEGQVSE